MKKFLFVILMLCVYTDSAYAQQPKKWMWGFVGGIFLTSNPDMSGYDVKKNYFDYGGGLVFDYRKDSDSGNFTFEWMFSPTITSCNTSTTEEGQSKMKFIFPFEHRFYVGVENFKFFLGVGFQYNFIYSYKETEHDNYYYGYYSYYGGASTEVEEDTGAHQFSGNGSLGISVLGSDYPVHFLLGTKFHFPIINNAEGVEYSNGSRFDLSKDKTSITATLGISINLGGKERGKYKTPILMINYDYPLGATKETSVSNQVSRSFFEAHSQSLTMSLLF